MWAVITWPFLSFTRKVVLGRAWMTSPSIWIASSLAIPPRPHGGADWSTKRTALTTPPDLRVIPARHSRRPLGSLSPRTPLLNPLDLPSLSLDDFVQLLVVTPRD